MYHYVSTYPLIVLLCCYLYERVTLIRINVEKQYVMYGDEVPMHWINIK